MARLRKERGWTQADLAEAADVSLQFIAALEQDTKAPSLDTIDKLCEAFAITASALFAAGEVERAAKPRSRTAAIERALAAVPEDREDDMLELVHVASRLLSRSAARKPVASKVRAPRR